MRPFPLDSPFQLSIAVSVFAGGLLWSSVPEKNIIQANSLTEQGTQALAGGDIDKAEAFFNKAIDLVPNYPDAHLGLGHVKMKKNAFAQALSSYERAKDCFPEIGSDVYATRIKNYQLIRDKIVEQRDTIQSLRHQLSSKPYNPSMLERKITQIEDDLRKLEAIQPPVALPAEEVPGEIFFFIGTAQFRLNQIDASITAWEKCAEMTPKFAMVHINLCVAYWRKGQFENARRHLTLATNLGHPVNPKMRVDLEKAATANSLGK